MKERRPIINFAAVSLFAAVSVFAAVSLFAASASGDDDARDAGAAVERGAESLRDIAPPWYDPSSDRVIVAKDIPVNATAGDEKGGGGEEEADKAAKPWRGAALFHEMVNVFFWCLIALLLIGIVYALAYGFLNREPVGETARRTVSTQASRVDQLPLAGPVTQQDFLEQARRHYQDGDLRRAVVCLFSYQLIHLDQHRLIRLRRGKTNRQYLLELEQSPQLREIVSRTMLAFEEVFFGGRTLDRGRFESCWNELERFHHSVREATK